MSSTTPSPRSVTDIDVKRYEETGLLFPIQVLAPAEVERFRNAVEETDRLLLEARPRWPPVSVPS